MKKTFFKLAHLWLICAFLLAFVWGVSHIFTLDIKIQMMILGFAIAPISEEILYRWLPVHLEKRFPRLGWFPGVLANFIFIGIHENNYPYAGIYWAFLIQGMLGFCCLWVCRKYGLWASIFLHAKYNVGIYLLHNYT